MSDHQTPSSVPYSDRADTVGFPRLVREHFAFLLDAGFAIGAAEPTYLRFERHGQLITVSHGRRSFELRVRLGWIPNSTEGGVAEEWFDLDEVLGLLLDEHSYVPRTATTPDQADRFLHDLATWTYAALARVDSTDDDVVRRLRTQRSRLSAEYGHGIRAQQLRERADVAWRAKDLASVIRIYDEINDKLVTVALIPSELARLRYARSQGHEEASKD